MQAEFLHSKTDTFTSHDYVKIIGQDWKTIDEATNDEINLFDRLFFLHELVGAYLRKQIKLGITDPRERVRLCSRKFFGKLTPQSDIDENGKFHIETH